jgi:hypothetical protein
MKARAIFVAYWVEVIGLAPVDGFATVSNSLMFASGLASFLIGRSRY